MKRSEAVDTWMRLEKHSNPTDALLLVAEATGKCIKAISEGAGIDAFIECLKAALDADPNAPKSNVKFDKWSRDGRWIDDPLELLEEWNERGDPERPCVKVRVLRLNEKTRKYRHAGYLDPPEVYLELIQARFRGGMYRIELLDIDGKYCTAVSGVGMADPGPVGGPSVWDGFRDRIR